MSEVLFNQLNILFNHLFVFFNGSPGSGVVTTDVLVAAFVLQRPLLATISITNLVVACFGRRIIEEYGTTDILEYDRKHPMTRFSKIYSGWNNNIDSPTPLYGVAD